MNTEISTALKMGMCARNEWKVNIEKFGRDNFGFEPDDWQREAFQKFQDPKTKRMSIKSGQGVGKTGFSAVVFLWFLTCFPNARVVATAPTRQQLNDVLWAELEKWREKSPLLKRLLKWTKTYIYVVDREKRWFGVARASSKPENMQGFHEDNMLFIVDEASGVDDEVLQAIWGTLSGDNNKLLFVGNPTKTSGMFYDSHTSMRNLWVRMTVDSAKSPRTNKENIEALIKKYGEESNIVRVRVHGLFPLAEDDVFIPLPLIEQSIMTDYKPRTKPLLIHIGCDVARFGDDKTIIGYKVDEKAVIAKKRHGQDLMKTADDIVMLGEQLVKKYKWNPHTDVPIPVKVDDGGLGGGVTDRLRQLKRQNPEKLWWLEVYPVKFGQRIKHKYYHDSTTYMMSVVKQLLQPFDDDGNRKPVELILPNDEDLVAQLSTRKYELTETSKIKIESKDAVKKRGQPSPDEADCVLLLCLPVKPPKRGVNAYGRK